MEAIRDRPLLTEIYPNVNRFTPNEESIYILGSFLEERSNHYKNWENKTKNIDFLYIESQKQNDDEQRLDSFTIRSKEGQQTIQLRSYKQIIKLMRTFRNKEVYIDITGIPHHIWAPLIKGGLSIQVKIRVVYVEPAEYSFKITPKEGEIFDLSERYLGITPIPGFASLTEVNNNDTCFIPLLGFEGIRLSHLMEEVEAPVNKIFPILGLPGFEPPYPFHTYQGNQFPLINTEIWQNVRFAIANCPFSLFYALEDIAKQYPTDFLKVAPIGTKPHALGLILYYLKYSDKVEIVYDHPIRKKDRSKGTSKLLVYDIYKLPL